MSTRWAAVRALTVRSPSEGRAVHKEEVKVPLDGLEQMFQSVFAPLQLHQLQLRARQTDIGRDQAQALDAGALRQAESGVRPISAS